MKRLMKRKKTNHIKNRCTYYQSSHKERSFGKGKRRTFLAVCSFLLVIAAIAVIAFFLDERIAFKGNRKDDYEGLDDEFMAGENEIDLFDKTYLINKKFDTFLFMGTDYSGNENGIGDDYQGSLCDYLMLLIINHTDDSYAFLPIDRNTVVDVPVMERDGSGEATVEAQVCTAHAYGGTKELGCENTVKAVSGYLGGLSIDGYYALSMSEISRINHELGGVTVTLTDDFSDKDPAMKAGATLTLTDSQAEIFLHARMDVADGTNKNRMARQRIYMEEAIKKLKSNMKEDSGYFKELLNSFSDVATSSISRKQIGRAANALVKYEDMGIYDIEGETKLGTILEDGLEHEEFYPDQDSLVSTMTVLYQLEEEED